MSYTKLATLSELEPETPVAVQSNGTTLVLVRLEDQVRALSGTCTHEAASLEGGFVEDGCIECPRHGAMFDLSTGEARTLPATQAIRIYPSRIEGEDVLVDLGEESP